MGREGGYWINSTTARECYKSTKMYNEKIHNVLDFLAALDLYPIRDKNGKWYIPSDETIDAWNIMQDEILCGENEEDRYDSI